MQHVQVIFTGEKAVGSLYTWLPRGNIFIYLSSIIKVVHEKKHMQIKYNKTNITSNLGVQMNVLNDWWVGNMLQGCVIMWKS